MEMREDLSPRQVSKLWDEIVVVLIGPHGEKHHQDESIFQLLGWEPDRLTREDLFPVHVLDTKGAVLARLDKDALWNDKLFEDVRAHVFQVSAT